MGLIVLAAQFLDGPPPKQSQSTWLESVHTSGYPTGNPPTGKMSRPYTKKKGEKGFIEGCLFALCCCWLCESCF
ncbi:hypothetical protein LOK49_LG10G02767 [Camellia lanceoleosa]|uniref:Uncharacterized protein n=1 Tax=Camellia lanceoleosa TaxID=1840588 RepID=A0ACC0G8H2_9ERIC|nr:hypothetical protein LOK49_LG10G02767 [Camellia lanceoleosa]